MDDAGGRSAVTDSSAPCAVGSSFRITAPWKCPEYGSAVTRHVTILLIVSCLPERLPLFLIAFSPFNAASKSNSGAAAGWSLCSFIPISLAGTAANGIDVKPGPLFKLIGKPTIPTVPGVVRPIPAVPFIDNPPKLASSTSGPVPVSKDNPCGPKF